MNTQILADLQAARARIEDPEHWAKDDYWFTSDGAPTFTSGDVCCMCALGAILCAQSAPNVSEGESTRRFRDAMLALDEQLPHPFREVPDFNDDPETTHADVLALFDRAIARQEQAVLDELASGE